MANSNNINHTQIQIPHHPDSKPATNSTTMVGTTAEQVIIMKKRVGRLDLAMALKHFKLRIIFKE